MGIWVGPVGSRTLHASICYWPPDVELRPDSAPNNFSSSRLPKASSSSAKSWPFSGPYSTKPHELLGAGFPTTSKPHGRFSIYRMARSPYFSRVDTPILNVKKSPGGTSISDDGRQRQTLERVRSVLDSDETGHICRIRQKSDLISGPCSRKPNGVSVIPPSGLQISKPHEHLGAGFPTTSKPHGGSSIYRMARSPYLSRVDPAILNVKKSPGGTISDDGRQRQTLKRFRSILHSDEIGPIRRIRQKSSLILAARNNARFGLDKEDLKDSSISSQHPYSLNELKNARSGLRIDEENRDTEISLSSNEIPPVPRKSVKTSLKKLEKFDKFTPMKLTTDMLNGRALKSMENVDSSQFVSMDVVIGTPDLSNSEFLQKNKGSQSEKYGKAQEN